MAWTAPRTWVAGELITAAVMNTHIRDNLAWLYSGEAWREVRSAGAGGSSLYVNGYTDYVTDGTFGPVKFKRVGGWTVIIGLCKDGTSGGVFTLPVGYRWANPTGANTSWIVGGASSHQGDGIVTTLIVGTNGVVTYGGNNTGAPFGWLSLTCIFPALA